MDSCPVSSSPAHHKSTHPKGRHSSGSDDKISAHSQGRGWLAGGFSWLLSSVPARLVVLLCTVGLAATGGWATSNIQQRFQPELLLPAHSYLR